MVCYDQSHANEWSLLRDGTVCAICNGMGTVPVYYLSIRDKIKQWCSSETMCKKMLAHWDDRNSWMPSPSFRPPVFLKELWHGSRFRELSWFWDPSSRCVSYPVNCATACRYTYSDVMFIVTLRRSSLYLHLGGCCPADVPHVTMWSQLPSLGTLLLQKRYAYAAPTVSMLSPTCPNMLVEIPGILLLLATGMDGSHFEAVAITAVVRFIAFACACWLLNYISMLPLCV